MRVSITQECIGCELCVEACAEVFEMGDEVAQVLVEEVPEEYQAAVLEAAEECPAEAIVVEEE